MTRSTPELIAALLNVDGWDATERPFAVADLANDAADRLQAILKVWEAYEALPFIDRGPARFGAYPALDAVKRAITGQGE